jgi:hypothetical protein
MQQDDLRGKQARYHANNATSSSTVCSRVAGILLGHARVRSSKSRTNARARAGLDRRIGAEHTNTRTKLGATERYHMLANMLGNYLAVLRVGVRENVLDEVVAILITRNVD